MKSKLLLRSSFSRLLIIFSLIFGLGTVSYAQKVTVKGKVTGDDGMGMPGVTIIEKTTTNGAVTDIDGNYAISVQDGNSVLIFSFIGMQTQEVNLEGRTSLNVALKADMTEVDEVVVTALGIKREVKKVGFAMTEVEGQEIASVNTVNAVQALQGKSAGLSIGTSDGGLFGNSKIQIRGVSVLNSNNNQPIFVVDGVILENSVSNSSADWNGSADDFGNVLKNLNPDEFKSVTVLKGAAATALYGSRGINGAVVVTTKDGAGSRGLGISVKQSIGIDHVYAQPDIQYEFGSGTIAGYVNYGEKDANGKYMSWNTNQFFTNAKGIPTKINHPGGYGYGPRFDGRAIEDFDKSMTTYSPAKNNMIDAYELGVNSNTSVAITGGNEKGTFYLSDSYNHRKGVFPNNEFTRNALKFAGSYNVAKWLKANASISFTTSTPKNPRNDLASNFLGSWENWYDTKKWNKSSVYQASHGGVPNKNYGDKYANVPGNSTWFGYNMNESIREEQVTRPVVGLTATLTNWLTLAAEGNMNYYTVKGETKTLGSGYANEGGEYKIRHESNISKSGKFTATINKNLTEDITANLIMGAEVWKQENSYSQIRTDGGLVVPRRFFLGNTKKTLVSEGKIYGTKQISSLFYFLNLGWKNQLFLDVTGRNDWSSALVYTNGTGNNSYFYPSVSASWLFSETLNLPSWVSFGKLRASWAQVGNDTGAYTVNKGYGVDKMELDGGKFVYLNNRSSVLVDPNIKPERKNSYEVGADVRFLNNRIGFDVAYYDETINDQIGELPLAAESGYERMLTNVGTLTNRGFEISLNATPIKTSNFEWNSTFNYWTNETRVSKLHKDFGEYKVLGGRVAYGNFRVGSVAFNGGKYGVLMSDSKPLEWKSDNADDPRNGMKILSWDDGKKGAHYKRSGKVEKVGTIQPDFECSWNNQFRYKNFTLSVLLDARFGGYIASYSNKYGTAYGFLKTSLVGRDAQNGGITWNSKYAGSNGQQFIDGIIPEGVFAEGQKVTTPAGTQVDVGGMTYREAYDKGYVEPTHASFFTYFNNSWSRGVVNKDWLSEVNYIALRNISIGYDLPKKIAKKLKTQNINLTFNARNLGYLYNSLPNNLNPESFRGTSSSDSFRERSFSPYTATYTFSVAVDF